MYGCTITTMRALQIGKHRTPSGVRIIGHILAVCLCILLATSAAHAATLTVSPNSEFQSIKKAITAAQPGDTIEVHPGIYNENLLIDKQITLIGIDRPTIHGNGSGSVIVITGDSSIIRGFRLEHSGNDLQTEDSGVLLKSSKNWIEQNELSDVLYGIYFYRSY